MARCGWLRARGSQRCRPGAPCGPSEPPELGGMEQGGRPARKPSGGPPSASGTCSLPPGESRDKLRTLVNKIGARTPEGPQNASGSSRPDWGSGLAEGRTPDARGRARTLTGTRQPRPQMSTQPGDTAWPSLEFFPEVPGEDRHPQRGVDPSAAWSARPGARLEQGASPLCPRHPRDARTPPPASMSTSVPLLPGPTIAMPWPCPADCPGPQLASPTFLPPRCPSSPLQPQALPLLPGQPTLPLPAPPAPVHPTLLTGLWGPTVCWPGLPPAAP